MTAPGKPWTMKRLERVWEQLRSGVDVRTIAAQQNCSVNNIHKRLRLNGYDPAQAHRADSSRDMQLERIYSMRMEGKEFGEIAEALGMPADANSTRCLYMRLVRYCERIGVTYPKQERKPRKSIPRGAFVPREDVIEVMVDVLQDRQTIEETTTVYDLADILRMQDRDAKAYVAELRRRGIVADGIVPTARALHAASLITEDRFASCYDAVIGTVVEAWRSDGPCATLETLAASVPFSKSYINFAIVKLRGEGYFVPRGHLYLRDRA